MLWLQLIHVSKRGYRAILSYSICNLSMLRNLDLCNILPTWRYFLSVLIGYRMNHTLNSICILHCNAYWLHNWRNGFHRWIIHLFMIITIAMHTSLLCYFDFTSAIEESFSLMDNFHFILHLFYNCQRSVEVNSLVIWHNYVLAG